MIRKELQPVERSQENLCGGGGGRGGIWITLAMNVAFGEAVRFVYTSRARVRSSVSSWKCCAKKARASAEISQK